jgi:hypothetical protein
VIEGLRATPNLPPGAQWATFLRNHDEVDLSRLTADQREDVFAAFGPDGPYGFETVSVTSQRQSRSSCHALRQLRRSSGMLSKNPGPVARRASRST